MNLKHFLKNKTVKNAGWLIGGRVVNKALAFLVSILTARYLGPDNFGLINYVTGYITLFGALCSLGINSVIIKNFVDHPDEEGLTIGTSVVLRAISSVLSAVMVVGIVSLVDEGEPTTVMVAVLSSIGLLFQVFDNLKQWFQSRLQSKYAAIAMVISYAVVSVYKLVLLITGQSVLWFALATSVEYIAVAVFLLLAYRRNRGPRFTFSWTKAKQLLSTSVSYIISGLMLSVYASTDKLMLKQMLDEASVGYYSTAIALCFVWSFLLEAIIESMYPSIIKAHDVDRALFERRNRQLYALMLYFSIAVSLVICLVAHPLVMLMYGKEYLPSVVPLRIAVWYTAFSYLGSARDAWVVSENKQKYLKYLYLGAALINVALNWVLIPVWGPSGAAVASLVTQISTTVVLPLLIKPLRPNAKLMLQALLLQGVFDKK